jgi:AraC family transcriptional activator of mtrCDE
MSLLATGARPSEADLDSLLANLEVRFLQLAECRIGQDDGVALERSELPSLYYCHAGMGRMYIGQAPPLALVVHTLLIVPPGTPCRLEAQSEMMFVRGCFRASYAVSVELFAALPSPIVETFTVADQLGPRLRAALEEFASREVGSGAMTTALLKQVLIAVLRRSVSSQSWAERFAILRDPKVARAFSDMVSRPAAPHCVQSLALTCGLSRSVFMSRFTAVFGESPMTILRQLRMRRARALLATRTLTLDQVASAVGYSSRSSFHRAFRKLYDGRQAD